MWFSVACFRGVSGGWGVSSLERLVGDFNQLYSGNLVVWGPVVWDSIHGTIFVTIHFIRKIPVGTSSQMTSEIPLGPKNQRCYKFL